MFDRFITSRNDDLYALPHLVKRLFDEADKPAASLFAPVDVLETDAEVKVFVEVAGLNRESLKVTFENGVLSVSGEKPALEVAEGAYFRGERRFGKFARNFTVPDRIDPSAIAAKYADGVLEITMPKVPAAQPRKIEVK